MDASQVLDPRKTIFVGGVPRPLRAVELALIMDRLYGGVCYAGIDVDPELKYPKGMFRHSCMYQAEKVCGNRLGSGPLQLDQILELYSANSGENNRTFQMFLKNQIPRCQFSKAK